MEALEDESIETERLRLRALEASDAARIAECIGDFDVVKMLSAVPYPYSVADAHEYLAGNTKGSASGDSFTRAIDMGGLIGVIAVGDIRAIEGGKVGEFGYWLAKPYWGKGIVTEAGRAMLRHVFETLEFAGLKSGHFKENFRSGNVLAKLGFRYAGEGLKHCLARKAEIPHVDVVLTRAQWLDYTARRVA